MADRSWRCDCGRRNTADRDDCADCGGERVTRRPRAKAAAPLTCSVDGAVLVEQGFCPQGGGFPLVALCPFVCPLCRQRLEWSGGCAHCFGSLTPDDRATWTMPGARYEIGGDGQHWVQVLDAGRSVVTRAEHEAGVAEVRRLLRMEVAG